MNIKEISEPIKQLVKLATRAQQIDSLIAETEQDYIGAEVLEHHPSGSYSVAVITAIEWDQSILRYEDGQVKEGDWIIQIKYLATGWSGWTGEKSLTLTEIKYTDLKKLFARFETVGA